MLVNSRHMRPQQLSPQTARSDAVVSLLCQLFAAVGDADYLSGCKRSCGLMLILPEPFHFSGTGYNHDHDPPL